MPEALQSAESVAWESPGGINLMILRRCDETESVLNVSIDGEAATIVAENCQYAVTDPERERKGKKPTLIKKLREFRLTVPVTRCQIVWKYAE